MFTGIIEAVGTVEAVKAEGSNIHFTIASKISSELKVDQSIAHNGVCLTVVELEAGKHVVTAVEETLKKSNIGDFEVGDQVNLERCMLANGRFDGHVVQGHVDVKGLCKSVEEVDGSWLFKFEFPKQFNKLIVDKGSITINGISLTVIDTEEDWFTVTIIPFTFEHTNIHKIKPGSTVNLEFDILGKYVAKQLAK